MSSDKKLRDLYIEKAYDLRWSDFKKLEQQDIDANIDVKNVKNGNLKY